MREAWEPALFLDEGSQALLEEAVAHVGAMECANRCVHHVPGRRCTDCGHFRANGYIGCDGYEQAPYRPMKRLRTLKAAAAATAILAVAVLCGCSVAAADPVEDAFVRVDDVLVERNVEADEQARWECLGILAEERAASPEAEDPCFEGQYDDGWYWEPCYEEAYYEPSYDSSDGFMQQGVRPGVDSATETWYPESAGRHYRTDEWHTDDEGYYRDADGYYVVASDDYPEGTVINTSKGEARVLDSGTYPGNVDFYVNW